MDNACTVTYYADKCEEGNCRKLWVGRTCADGNTAYCLSKILKKLGGKQMVAKTVKMYRKERMNLITMIDWLIGVELR